MCILWCVGLWHRVVFDSNIIYQLICFLLEVAQYVKWLATIRTRGSTDFLLRQPVEAGGRTHCISYLMDKGDTPGVNRSEREAGDLLPCSAWSFASRNLMSFYSFMLKPKDNLTFIFLMRRVVDAFLICSLLLHLINHRWFVYFPSG
jgi:hypothetical protein